MKLKMVDMKGKAAGEIEVSDDIFSAEVKKGLIHQVVVAQLANKRQGTMSNLTRAEVRGGGRKPYRQKGTGRARHGSSNSPIWVGGGVAFAKKPRDFSKKVNKQMKDAAFVSALSGKVADGDFIVLKSLQLKQPKTKEIAALLEALKIDKRALIVTADKDEAVVRSANNIGLVTTTTADFINVYDLVANKKCVITADAVKKIEEAYNV